MEPEAPEAPEGYAGGAPPPGSLRACDQCRLRKIRCDKSSPCSNCRIAKRTCSSTGAGQKPKEPRQRVLISSQYERKIDQIEERLAGIENLLRNLTLKSSGAISEADRLTPNISPLEKTATSSSRGDGGGGAGFTGDSESPPPSTVLGPDEDENYEGTSSLAAHTAFASEFLQDAVERTSMLDGGTGMPWGGGGGGGCLDFNNMSPKIEDALTALRRIVDMQKTTTGGRYRPPQHESPRRNPITRVNLGDLPMPPMSLVVEKLKESKHSPSPAMQSVVFVFSSLEIFTDRCRRVYFTTEEPSEGAFMIVNAGLASLFFEARFSAEEPAARARFDACRDMCTRNLEIALSQLNLMMPATLENIEALAVSASFSIDLSRPSLAWTLTSRAAHMCRTLGLHQASPAESGPEDTGVEGEAKGGEEGRSSMDSRLLFWGTYILDKGLSLRMGRASVLQDYDISQTFSAEWERGPFPTGEVLNLWIRHSRIQGNIYEHLYSPAALAQPQDRRVERVNAIVAEVNHAFSETHELLRRMQESQAEDGGQEASEGGAGAHQQHQQNQQQKRNPSTTAQQRTRRKPSPGERQIYADILQSDKVSYLSSLTLAYRALPPMGSRSRTFANECIDAARETIRCHLETMEYVEDRALKISHLHWSILNAPFIPFIVIFCLVIETGDVEDLQRMADFITSLEVAKDMSPSVGKLHHLCQVLYNVAILYMEAKAQRSPVGATTVSAPITTLAAPAATADQDMSVPPALGDEFDMYLSQLGFMPADLDMVNADLPADDHTRSVAQTAQLGDWFSGNNYMLGLLEGDLPGPNAFGFQPDTMRDP